MGYVSWIEKYEEEDSYLVTLQPKAGAVFYVKTSVPQSQMVYETVSNVIGRTITYATRTGHIEVVLKEKVR